MVLLDSGSDRTTPGSTGSTSTRMNPSGTQLLWTPGSFLSKTVVGQKIRMEAKLKPLQKIHGGEIF
jgi:hypothetical protein